MIDENNAISITQPIIKLGDNKNATIPEQQAVSLKNSRVPPYGGCITYVVVVLDIVIYLVLLERLQSHNVDRAEVKAVSTLLVILLCLIY